jgi:homoserine kinase type II
VQPVLPGDLLDPSNLLQAAAAGVTLARLHHALAHYPGTRDFAPLCLPVTSWNKHCGRQLVHHDFRAANILWNQDGITAVLDLEEICWGRRVDDLAWAAVHLGTRYRHWSPVAPTVHTAFLNAYDTHLPLTAAEQVDLPVLLARYTRQLQHT